MPTGTKKTGRPSLRTEAVETAILLALRAGKTKRESARLGGVTYTTMNEWENRFPEFADAVKNAVEVAKNDLIATIQAASQPSGKSPGQWQAAAWLLERRWPTEFARTDRLEVTFDPRTVAEKVAAEYGLDASEVLAEAERHLSIRR